MRYINPRLTLTLILTLTFLFVLSSSYCITDVHNEMMPSSVRLCINPDSRRGRLASESEILCSTCWFSVNRRAMVLVSLKRG